MYILKIISSLHLSVCYFPGVNEMHMEQLRPPHPSSQQFSVMTKTIEKDMFIFVLTYSRGARVSFGLWILKVNGPARNLHILNPEVVLLPVWGATFGNQWEYYELSLTSCVIFRTPLARR